MDIREQMARAKFRAVLKNRLNGDEFPIYLETEAEAAEAAEFLKAEVVSIQPTSAGQFAADLINALARGNNIINS